MPLRCFFSFDDDGEDHYNCDNENHNDANENDDEEAEEEVKSVDNKNDNDNDDDNKSNVKRVRRKAVVHNEAGQCKKKEKKKKTTAVAVITSVVVTTPVNVTASVAATTPVSSILSKRIYDSVMESSRNINRLGQKNTSKDKARRLEIFELFYNNILDECTSLCCCGCGRNVNYPELPICSLTGNKCHRYCHPSPFKATAPCVGCQPYLVYVDKPHSISFL